MTDPILARMEALERRIAELESEMQAIRQGTAQALPAGPSIARAQPAAVEVQPGLPIEGMPSDPIQAIQDRQKTPTGFYAWVWNETRKAVGLGPLREMGPLMRIFQQLHASAGQNTHWAGYAIICYFADDYAAQAGWTPALFARKADAMLMEAKRLAIKEPKAMPVGTVGHEADAKATPEEMRAVMAKLLAKLKPASAG